MIQSQCMLTIEVIAILVNCCCATRQKRAHHHQKFCAWPEAQAVGGWNFDTIFISMESTWCKESCKWQRNSTIQVLFSRSPSTHATYTPFYTGKTMHKVPNTIFSFLVWCRQTASHSFPRASQTSSVVYLFHTHRDVYLHLHISHTVYHDITPNHTCASAEDDKKNTFTVHQYHRTPVCLHTHSFNTQH